MPSLPRAARARPVPTTPPPPVPAAWQEDIQRVLVSPDQIARRVAEIAGAVNRDFARHDLVIVAVLNGTVMFLADLVRHLTLPLRLDFVGVSSYRDGTTSGELVFTKPPQVDLRGRDVLVVDDILDTGKTLHRVLAELRRARPRRLRTCLLLEKKSRREIRVRGDYIGFTIPDEFVVGYGLDYAERYRNLPFIGILKPEVFNRRVRQPVQS